MTLLERAQAARPLPPVERHHHQLASSAPLPLQRENQGGSPNSHGHVPPGRSRLKPSAKVALYLLFRQIDPRSIQFLIYPEILMAETGKVIIGYLSGSMQSIKTQSIFPCRWI